MAMKSEQAIREMLGKFDDRNDEGELDCDGESILEALRWVVGIVPDVTLEEYLEEM